MSVHEIIERYFYEHLGAVKHDNRPFVPFEQAEYSPLGYAQDAFFKSANLAQGLVEVLAEHGYVIKKRFLEPVE